MADPLYIQFNHDTMLEAKKQILVTQINSLNILRNINNYRDLRKKEFMYKLKIKNDLKHIKETISKMNEKLPKIHHKHTPELDETKESYSLKKSQRISLHGEKEVKEVKRDLSKENSIEEQLLDIQKKLSELSS